jgi:hypothetical protein
LLASSFISSATRSAADNSSGQMRHGVQRRPWMGLPLSATILRGGFEFEANG